MRIATRAVQQSADRSLPLKKTIYKRSAPQSGRFPSKWQAGKQTIRGGLCANQVFLISLTSWQGPVSEENNTALTN